MHLLLNCQTTNLSSHGSLTKHAALANGPTLVRRNSALG